MDAVDPFELAIEAAPSGVLVVTNEGAIVHVNRAAERQFGYDRGELAGQPVDALLLDGGRAVQSAIWQAQSSGIRLDLVGIRRNGSRLSLGVSLTSVERAGKRCVLVSLVESVERDLQQRGHPVTGQMAFEQLVTELSGCFLNISKEEIDRAIRDALSRICVAIGVDRGAFYRAGPDGTLIDEVRWAVEGLEIDAVPLSAANRFPWSIERLLTEGVVSFSTLGEVPSAADRRAYEDSGTRSAIAMGLVVAGRVVGALAFQTLRSERTWTDDAVNRLKLIAGVFGQAIAWQEGNRSLRAALAEVERLQDQLQSDNTQLRREISERTGQGQVLGHSAALRRVQEQVQQVAATDSTVLLLGETGTGKELLATQIHGLSARRPRTMVRVNCAAIPATLIESELFGREKGAFTGALARQVGRFELAHGSTIFLDEIGDLPLDTQVKLLRVLEERHIERLGSPQPIPVDVRIIVATHRNLEQRIAEGLFRADLYYRLNVFPIHVPPLRDRVEDIPILVWGFVEEFSRAFGKRVDSIAEGSLAALQHYTWPGNLRELRNVVERAMITSLDHRLVITPPQPSIAAAMRSSKLVDVERQHIRAVLDGSGWRIRGSGGAAERLGLKPTTLETRMAKLGLKRPRQTPLAARSSAP
ncbi:MAG TPA: sigma 54-interacting transcriptional regulator [Vicinamibacterales bacterium]|nr:sigma 54-interacting transcriptional regulator [Vicinamibacterales bacterium]